MVKTDIPAEAFDAPLQPGEHERAAIARIHLLHGQLATAAARAAVSDLPELRSMDFLAAHSPYMQQLAHFYLENLPLARLLDSSDLLLHAEGPAAASARPRLNAVNWLCSTVERRIKAMVEALLPMAHKAGQIAARQVDLRLTGLAPGSLYAGFSLEATHLAYDQKELVHEGDAETLEWLRSSVHALPVVPQFVQADSLDPQIVEALPDPALRDAAIVAAYELSPTGKRDIHTLEISAPRATDANARSPRPLGQKERVVLRHALHAAPVMRRARQGQFVGMLRAIDLDTGRIIVRNISAELTALRGVLRIGSHQAQGLLGKPVRITGEYDCDPAGRPRLMRVDQIERVQGDWATEEHS